MKKKEEELSGEELKKKTLKQFMSGESLYAKDGAFAPMQKGFLEAVIEGVRCSPG